MNYLKPIILFILLFSLNNFPQNPPPDFKLVGTAGGNSPGTISETITILANGQVKFFRFKGNPPQILLDTNFTITTSQVQQIWQSIQNNNFFSLSSNYKDETFHDGSVAIFTITADGTTKQVKLRNMIQQQIQEIVTTINSNVPADYILNYTPPEKLNIVPIDPCGGSIGSSPSLLKKDFLQNIPTKMESIYYSTTSVKDGIQIPHGGVAIGYEMSLFQAIAAGKASLKSKGEFFGDAVSITGYNIIDGTPPGDTISIKLYMEFYGPCANDANVGNIVADILTKWDGHTTSNGKTIKMDVPTLLHPGVELPPGTPGFNNIKLECGNGRSSVNSLGVPNTNAVVGGTWYPLDQDYSIEGIWGHEAGHLMGLDDQYDEFTKRPEDGYWVDEQDETISYPPDDFLNLYRSHFPYLTLSDAQKFLNENQSVTLGKPGHENDLMNDNTKPPLQSDIDLLAAQAGLIININAGDVLSSLADTRQNLLVIHSGDLFLLPGEIKTLNGIYAACLDAHRIMPGLVEVFNVAPSLDKWNGISAAADLLKLIKYVDSTKYYCGDDRTPQNAIWRITDNYSAAFIDTSKLNSLFDEAGIYIGNQIYNFPRLTFNSSFDTISKAVVPNELFFPDIQPKVIQAEIGENLTFNAIVSKPSGFDYTTGFSWLLDSPEGSSSQISSTGSFVPDIKGKYDISLKIDITDPENNTNEYYPELTACAVVPDEFTETFEHANLNRFHWETFGDSKWEITNSDAQTGSYSVKPGGVAKNQSTTLAINVDLPKDSSIVFAIKIFTNYGTLNFYIDDDLTDYWNDIMDWEFFKYELDAGGHRLIWEFKNYFNYPSYAWLDNIFFPSNSVVTGVEDDKEVPSIFSLSQNFPNPYNPETTIKYSVSKRSIVIIKIFDVLGNEIKTLINNEHNVGHYEVNFDASFLSSGIYFFRMQADNFTETKKMILMK